MNYKAVGRGEIKEKQFKGKLGAFDLLPLLPNNAFTAQEGRSYKKQTKQKNLAKLRASRAKGGPESMCLGLSGIWDP